MQHNVSDLLREPVGCQWGLEVDEAGTAEPVTGERIQGQLRLTRIHLDSGQGVWTEAQLRVQTVQVCDRRLSFRQPVRADFTELYRPARRSPTAWRTLSSSSIPTEFSTWGKSLHNTSYLIYPQKFYAIPSVWASAQAAASMAKHIIIITSPRTRNSPRTPAGGSWLPWVHPEREAANGSPTN